MKVLHILSVMMVGGIQKFLLNLLPRLKSSDVEVEVICIREKGEWAPILEEKGIPVSLVKVKKRGWTLRTIMDILKLSFHLSKKRPDLVHLHRYPISLRGGVAALILGIPYIMHYHGMREPESPLSLKIERLLLRRAKAIIAVSQAVKRDIVERLDAPHLKISVIHIGVDPADYASKSSPSTDLHIPSSGYTIGMVARLVPVKRVPDFVKAVSILEGLRKDMACIFIGDGKENRRAKIEKMRRDLGLTSLILAGKRSDVPNILSSFDVGVLTSEKEGQSIVLIEYLLSGAAVVATEFLAAFEIIENHKCGLLAPVGDCTQIASAISYLLDNPRARRKLKANGLRRSKRFLIDKVALDCVSLYERVLSQNC